MKFVTCIIYANRFVSEVLGPNARSVPGASRPVIGCGKPETMSTIWRVSHVQPVIDNSRQAKNLPCTRNGYSARRTIWKSWMEALPLLMVGNHKHFVQVR